MLMPKMIGTAEASEILRIDRSTVTRWYLDGKLPGQKLPGQTGAYVFDLADVEKLRDKILARRSVLSSGATGTTACRIANSGRKGEQ